MELKQGQPIEKIDDNINYSPAKKSRLPFIVIITLIIVIILGTSFYLGLNKVKQDSEPAVQTQVQPTPFISPTPTDDPTVDWKIFRDNEIGVEFKYPSNFSYTGDSINNTQDLVDFTSGDKKFRFDRFVAPYENEAPYNITSITKNFNGNSWKVVVSQDTTQFCDGDDCSDIVPNYYIYKNGYRYSFTYSKDLKELVDQILSTFQFLDQSLVTPTIVVDETANWQTYSNTEYAFSFKYPGTFELEERQVAGSIGMNIELITVNPKINFSIYDLDYPDVSNWVFEHSGLGNSGIGYFPSARDIKASTKGNLQTVEFTDNIPGTSVETKSVVFSKNNKAYVFTLLDSANSILFTQILSTFQFTE